MDATQQRANGFVLPGEDPDQLINAAQSALATVPQMSGTITALQQQNQQLQQMVQQSRDMVMAMMLQQKEMQAQLTTGRLMPVVSQLVGQSGLLSDLPTDAITGLALSREITPEGGVTERLDLTFDPVGVIQAEGKAAYDRACGQAQLNHSRSALSKLLGRGELDRSRGGR